MLDWMWVAFGVSLVAIAYGWTKRPPPDSDVGGADARGVRSKADSSKSLPKMQFDEEEEDGDVEATKVGAAAPEVVPTKKIVYDDDAAADEPTHGGALFLLTATAQTDAGRRRKRNEDSLLVNEDEGLFVVADGMGGYRGGEIASKLAVTTIGEAFVAQTFAGVVHEALPKRASELARAIQMANDAIRERAEVEKHLQGMGTTIVAARFSPQKQRLYVGHVGDSRMYRLRGGQLKQVTSDHTMESELGVGGDASGHLSRAVGVWPSVAVDIIVAKPLPNDVYLLCSDGLTKMASDQDIRAILMANPDPNKVVEDLVEKANANGGKDNVTVIVIRVADPLSAGAKAEPKSGGDARA